MRGLFLTLPLVLFFAASCGGDEDDDDANDAETTATSGTPAASPTSATMSPAELGEAIGVLYVDALRDLGKLLQPRPSAAELQPKVAALKETYITKLVELGKKRQALSAADRSTVDARLRTAINGVPSDVYTAFSEGLSYYQKAGDPKLAELIQDFNIITQYADFDLLKKQEPEEAKRLGIQ